MLIDRYDVEVFTPPCEPGAERFSARALLTTDIIRRRCPAQDALCKAIPACPREAIRYVADENEPLGGVIVFDTDECDGCGQCALACCGNAIEMR